MCIREPCPIDPGYMGIYLRVDAVPTSDACGVNPGCKESDGCAAYTVPGSKCKVSSGYLQSEKISRSTILEVIDQSCKKLVY